MVKPMKSGMMVERRDQVLIGFLSLFACAVSTFFTRWASQNGPFFNERVMSYPWSAGPMATLDDDLLPFYLHHHRAGDRPDSRPHRERLDEHRASASHQ